MANSSWYNRNNFDQNIEYVEGILKSYNISQYNFIQDNNGHQALCISYCLNSYKVVLDEENEIMIVERKRGYNRTNHSYKTVFKVKEDAILESIKFIYNNKIT